MAAVMQSGGEFKRIEQQAEDSSNFTLANEEKIIYLYRKETSNETIQKI
jgi:hypothetical protein